MTKRVRLIVYILIALFGWNFPVTLHVAQGQSPTYVPDEVIVKYRDSVDEYKKEIGRVRVAGQRKRQFKLVRGLEVIKLGRNVSVAEAIDLLKQDPDVLYAEPNYRIFLTGNPKINLTPNDPSMGSLWGLTKINAPGAWNNSTGSANVAVGILDTGFDYTHGDLSANIFNNPAECVANGADNDGNGYEDDCHGIDVVNGDTDPIDDNGHGTHVAGTIGAVGNNGTGVVGVNWNVKMLSCKVFDANGSGSTDDAVLCLEYFEFMKVNRGVNIIATNNSWGGGDYSQALYDAIDAQREAGILFIAAAGNGNAFGVGQNNDSIPLYPCNYFVANMICVAATTSNDGKASFSNFGRRTVHVGAPGQNILSTVPGGYSSSDGTSMATPHVTGLAALLKAQDSNRDWRAIKNLILAGGNTVSSMANTISGRRINALGSMTCSNTAIQTRLQPIATTISASPGVPVVLASLNINCANPNGNVSVSVSSGGGTITLLDDGSGSDQAAGDGIYSGVWTPTATGTYTLTFPGNDRVTVNVANPTISVSPTTLNFGAVAVGSSADRNITVTNSGGGVLVGNASTSAPFSIVSGGSYSVSAGQSQTVTVRYTPPSLGTFTGNVSFTGGAGASVTVSGTATAVSSVTPNPVDLASPPASFTLTGSGFANLGFGLPVVNFVRNGVTLGQVRATSVTNTTLVVPFPTTQGVFGPVPGLSAGSVTVAAYNQTAPGDDSWGLVGSTSLTVNDTRTPPSVSSITPNPIDLASPPTSFTLTGNGFANLGFGLPVANFVRNGVNLGQVRATSVSSTTLVVPFPTTQGVFGPVPGLSAGPVTVDVYNQTGSGSSSWGLVGSTSLTVNDTRTPPSPPSVSSITPNPIDLASPPTSFTLTGNGFANLGFGLPVANFTRNGTLLGQVRATSVSSTTLVVPFPTTQGVFGNTVPGLSAGPVTVDVYNQTGSGSSSWGLVGSTSLAVNDTRTPPSPPSVNSIMPNPVSLASPPTSFNLTGNGFANLGFGLPVANFTRNGTLLGQVRATSVSSTTLVVPFPTTQGVFGNTVPGLSAGSVTVDVYNQTAPGDQSWSLVGSTSLTVNN